MDLQSQKESRGASQAFKDAEELCRKLRNECVTPEHILAALVNQSAFVVAAEWHEGCSVFKKPLAQYLDSLDKIPEGQEWQLNLSAQMTEMWIQATLIMENASFGKQPVLTVPHLVGAMTMLKESQAAYFLGLCAGGDVSGLMKDLVETYSIDDDDLYDDNQPDDSQDLPFKDDDLEYKEDDDLDFLKDDDLDFIYEDDDDSLDFLRSDEEEEGQTKKQVWQRLVTCLNDTWQNHNPLIGRDAELERTIQVLCRKEKNNPLHVGEPGVGKTSLIYGLTQRIVEGRVPDKLKGCKVYQLDLGSLLAGTTYRGDFEKRVKQVMEGAQQEGNAIVYIDEIHNLVGAGADSGSIDGAHLMMPYLERGDVRVIGSTTYELLKRQFIKNQAMARRFHQIDIPEPSKEETLNILMQLRPNYEKFHGVVYEDEALRFAVEASAKYINDRFLPDKAIDLIDEAGAALQLAPDDSCSHRSGRSSDGQKTVDKQLIAEILAKTCKVDALAMKDDDNAALETLNERISAKIYGQDEAVRQVVEAVQMSKAGLLDDGKPLASLLFVGPTGVGKTEVARVLAHELGIELLRFDMSEYTEKHTVAKLIGSPAGYVGYEDGGLLTDAIRKTPNCVLLLDEIEKAHQDIYNVLLQVMDYAHLTDNRGQKADFRNVILIMTSNAGAQYAGRASIGFQGKVSRGEAMLQQVKKTFKPEFINRLSATVVFHDMDETMAKLILRKKLGELQEKLTARKVTMTLTDDAFALLLREGFTREYGAREMDRVINSRLKPLLMREILFGSLKDGGETTITTDNGQLKSL